MGVSAGFRAASLPPQSPAVSVDSLSSYRRRPSVTSIPGTMSRARAGSIQVGYAGLPPRSGDVLSSAASAAARRSSYSGGSRFNDPAGLGPALGRRPSVSSSSWSAASGGLPGSRGTSVERSTPSRTTPSYPLPTPPSTPNMSDTRRKIRQVLYKVSGDEDYLQ